MNLLYINLNILSLLCVVILIVLSYKNREQPCASSFLYAMLFMGLWVISSTVQLLSNSFFLSVLFLDLMQLGMAFVSVMNYRFVLIYTELSRRPVYRRILLAFTMLNVLAMLLLFTDPLHHWLRASVEASAVDDMPLTLTVVPTPLGAFFILLRFLLFGFATLLLFRFLFSTFKNMRKQVMTIGLGFLIALISLVLKQYWLEDIGVTVPMSVILIVPYIFIGVGVFRFNFLSISPLAKDWVIDSLKEGIVVFSKDGKILEQNTAARNFIERHAAQIDPEALARSFEKASDSVHELSFEGLHGEVYYEITLHHLVAANGKRQGSVAVIRDITDQTRRHHALLRQADCDSLTQVLNKKAIEREYAALTDGPLCLLIIDVDKFKQINDTYGHPVGDAVLLGLVQAMKKSLRKQDLIGRIGGDEFCIILSQCGADLCRSLSQRLADNIRRQAFDVGCPLPPIEVSIGAKTDIDNAVMSFAEAYSHADAALYEAKNLGRDQAVIR